MPLVPCIYDSHIYGFYQMQGGGDENHFTLVLSTYRYFPCSFSLRNITQHIFTEYL